jgi:hypothetical protein
MSKTKNNRSHLARNVFILVVVLLTMLALVGALNQLPPTSQVSTSSSALSAGDFYVASTGYLCIIANDTGFKVLDMTSQLTNHRNIAFHFLSAKILVANYTLANGTVVSLNKMESDTVPTFEAVHRLSISVDTNIPKSGPKITNIGLTITVYIQEVSEPITLPLNVTTIC